MAVTEHNTALGDMRINQEGTSIPVSCEDELAEAGPRQHTNHRSQPKPPARRKSAIVAAALVVATLVGWAVYHRLRSGTTTSAGAAAARGQTLPVAVVEGMVSTMDVPIYLDGLGTIQAFNTVTIHTRVDGQLVKVAFTEGQDVKTGDLLAQIDSAPYQAAFDQTAARKAQDEAQLANARVDLQRYADLLKTDSITQQIYDTQKALVSQFEATVRADQAATESAKVNLDYTTILSPIDGHVGINGRDRKRAGQTQGR